MWKEMSFLIAHHAQHITGFLKTELMISIDIYVSVNPNQILKAVLSIWNALFVVPMLAYLCPKTSQRKRVRACSQELVLDWAAVILSECGDP